MKIKIIKETEAYILVWKAANLPTTPTKENPECLISKIVDDRPELKQVQGYRSSEYGLLNRLDTRTAGVVIIAKSQNSFDVLNQELKSEAFVKVYLAYCYNLGSKRKGTINTPIAHHPTKKSRMVLIRKGTKFRGKPQYCETYFEKITSERAINQWRSFLGNNVSFPSLPNEESTTWILCRITKGKRHQIRLHLKSIGYPIVGDALYKTKTKIKRFELSHHALYAIGIVRKKKERDKEDKLL
ncbi:MAG: pseudouridine synthase [Candidatus Hermodarchaeota archaeon]